MRRCIECLHWKQTSAFKNYDGGYPGRCHSGVPLWVSYLHGEKSTDRIMSSNQDARECDAFAQPAEAHE
jgi:hypothetical protein